MNTCRTVAELKKACRERGDFRVFVFLPGGFGFNISKTQLLRCLKDHPLDQEVRAINQIQAEGWIRFYGAR